MAERNPVAVPCTGYENMSEKWDMLHDLIGGTKAMREAGEKWLPKEPGESITKYDARLNRSILYNGYSDTLDKLSNKPFSHAMTVTELPEELNYLLEDVDTTGKSLESLTQEILYNLMEYGVVHLFVDHSVVEPVANGETATKADEDRMGARVIITCVSATSLIGWRTEVDEITKQVKLTQIRMFETKMEPDGEYGDAERHYIRVIGIDYWELWQQDEKEKDLWVRISKGTHTFGSVPLITLYANRTGFMTADPPLEDLAWMNIIHWQSYSDQRNILRLSRFGILFGKGLPKSWSEKTDIEIGPTRSFFADDPNADMKFVEHTGKSIESGQKDVEDIEQKMEVLGNMPMVKQQKKLATSVRLDSDRNSSQLQAWIRGTERGLRDTFGLACQWRAIDVPEELTIDIYSEFEVAMLGSSDKEFILKTRQAGELSQETFLKEIKRRGALADSVEVQDEIDRLANEAENEISSFLPKELEDGDGE